MGPKLESWAFAIDAEGLEIVLERGVFHMHACKLCDDGVVVMGEYGITTALFDRGFTVDTLMAKYGSDVDWHHRSNWYCNDQVPRPPPWSMTAKDPNKTARAQ